MNKYSSFGDFIESCRQQKAPLKSSDIVASTQNFDPSHPLYGKVCVFTGTLEKMTRKDAMQLVADLGGINGDSVTKKTNYLILGNNDYCPLIKDGKSNKQKKAESLILNGADLAILPENTFYDLAGDVPFAVKEEKNIVNGIPMTDNDFTPDEMLIFRHVCNLITESGRDSEIIRCRKDSSNILCISAFYDILKIKLQGKKHYITFNKHTDLSIITLSDFNTEPAGKNENTLLRFLIQDISEINKYSPIILANYDEAVKGNSAYIRDVKCGQKNFENYLRTWYC